jgi:hypothetical protein
VALPQSENTRNQIAQQQNALDHLERGYSVIPVRRAHAKKERIPLVKWSIYQSLRPTAGEVRAWWAAWPDANPVVVTGSLSGIIALDVDGAEGLAWLLAQDLPPTLTISRGAPGRYHFWFKYPGFRVSNKTLHPQVEVKGDGGLIPCPGALHWSGAPYRVVRQLDIAACPAFLVNLLKTSERPAPRPYQPAPDDDALIALAVDALSAARSDNREAWLSVLMALHSAGEQYRALAHTFSARCPEKYQPRIVDQTWNSFKRSGITLATLFKMADEDSPGWRPAAFYPTPRTAAAFAAYLTIPDWPQTLPEADQRLFFTYWGQQGKAISAVLRAILQHIGAMTWFDLAELQARSGLARRTLYHVFTAYGLGQLLDTEKGSGLLCATLTGDLSSQDQSQDQQPILEEVAISQSGTKQQGAKKPGCRYRLPARAVFWERVLKYRIRAIEEQHDQPAKITPSMGRTLDASTPPAQLAAGNAPIEAALSEEEKRDEARKANRLEARLNAIRRELADTTCIPLPEVVDGKAWYQDYVGAVVEQYGTARIGTQEARTRSAAALGLSPSTLYRAEKRLGFYREETYSPEALETTDPGELPPLIYDKAHTGYPARLTLLDRVTPDGEYPMYDYRGEVGQQVAQEATQRGEQVRIEYQQAGIIRRKSEAERAAEKAQAEAALAAQPPKPTRSPLKPAITPPYYTGLDYEYSKARRLVIERLVKYHGFDDLDGAVKLHGDLYADKPFAALGGPDLMRLTRFERLIIRPEAAESTAAGESPGTEGGEGKDSLLKPDPVALTVEREGNPRSPALQPWETRLPSGKIRVDLAAYMRWLDGDDDPASTLDNL